MLHSVWLSLHCLPPYPLQKMGKNVRLQISKAGKDLPQKTESVAIEVLKLLTPGPTTKACRRLIFI